jgi:hypothetical protein
MPEVSRPQTIPPSKFRLYRPRIAQILNQIFRLIEGFPFMPIHFVIARTLRSLREADRDAKLADSHHTDPTRSSSIVGLSLTKKCPQ